ncbi:M16 family metallopeptidase [Calycomorphotria hydatis]|uniref:Peptidase M16 inactive domain protein n=1 Tax=Calycomorphotria hydatis TaxID=2528027 RepID=A0A517T3L4_9PLAN|nr:pitrilysin family protein [Calycomorphotria hydatis]QDT62931.1 Peptidase M16 inactive domain protein [Calycomorphotria hydatis]
MAEQQTVHTHELANGLTLLVEPMAGVRSAAFSILVPAGCVYDPKETAGTAAVLTELISRGAGDLDSRELSSALDNLGTRRVESTGASHLSFSAATVAENIPAALRLYRDVLRSPHLPEAQFEAARASVVQTVLSNEDDPRSRVMTSLRRNSYEAPWGDPSDGTLDGLKQLSHSIVKQHYDRCFHPNGTIIGIAGHVDFEELRDLVIELFDDWAPGKELEVTCGGRGPALEHMTEDLTQTHIGLAYDAVPYPHEDYFTAWAAVSVLSGGMSSRLFTEVREKRGLCYAISASLRGTKEQGRVMCYAGTTNERAQETLDVTIAELRRLGEGIEPGELERCKARAKSALIMQQESTISRSGSLARDWDQLGRVRPIAEVQQRIDSLTVEDVLRYARDYPAEKIALVTLGPTELSIS